MLCTIAPHKEKTVETVVLKHADFVKWMLDQKNATGPLKTLLPEVKRLISIFNAKPIVGKCRHCSKSATRFSIGTGNSKTLLQWCDSCDPYKAGAAPGKLTVMKTYRDALDHIEADNQPKSAYKAIIKAVAAGKGLPAKSGAAQIAKFFA